MSKLTRTTFFAQFLPIISNHKWYKEGKKDENKLEKMNCKSPSSKKINNATPSNKSKNVIKDKMIIENKTTKNNCNSTPLKGSLDRMSISTPSNKYNILNKDKGASENEKIKNNCNLTLTKGNLERKKQWNISYTKSINKCKELCLKCSISIII